MRDHNKAFCSLVAETFDCPGPVFEFGSYQVDGQEGYANLVRFSPQRVTSVATCGLVPAWTAWRTSRRSACPTNRPARCCASKHSSMSSR